MQALRFEGTGKEYFKIWIVNILLIIVTIGVYYPWAKVRTKRYFYANTLLEDRNFEYHATGKQLFLGFLIAVGLFALYTLLHSVFPIGGTILSFVFIGALPWIIWRSMKFNMLMTSFSNVRFGFAGELKQAYINFFAYPVALYLGLGIVVLIFFIPARMFKGDSLLVIAIVLLGAIAIWAYLIYAFSFVKQKNTEYLLNGTRYGQGIFSTNITVKTLMKIVLKASLLSFGIYIAIYILAGLLVGAFMIIIGGLGTLSELKPDSAKDLGMIVMGLSWTQRLTALTLAVIFYVGLIYLVTLLGAYYTSRNRNYIYGQTSLDEKITFASTLKARPYAWILMTNFLAVVFSIGLAYPWAKVRQTRYLLEHTEVNTEVGFDSYVSDKQKIESSLGDQIGDAFNIDVGIGL